MDEEAGMQFPLRSRRITVTLERLGPVAIDRPELIEASDRDMELLARSGRAHREPRWEVPTMMLGLRP